MKQKRLLVFLTLLGFLFAVPLKGRAQSFFENDTVFNKKRMAWTTGAVATGWVGTTVALQTVWYQNHWTNKFHFFDDSKEWMQMDKFGHAYTGLAITKNISGFYRWSGVSRGKSLLIGSGVAFGYLGTIEILDGFSKDWGFSWSDIVANSSGIIWYAWQDLVWQEQRLQLKFSVHLSPYAQYRPNVLGANFGERILKDYNAQTYWISISPGQFIQRETNFPKWLSFSLGYSIDQKLVGHEDYYSVLTDFGEPIYFRAQRQFLFSLDINFEEIPTEKKWLKAIFKVINHVKVPFPALIFSNEGVKVHPFYF